MRRCVALLAVLGCIGAALPRGAVAQLESRIQTGARLDVLVSTLTAVHAGLELSTAASTNVRVALTTAVGESSSHGRTGLSARAEVVGRYLLDPNFSMRWAPYAGGGLGIRYDKIDNWRGTIIIVLGVEGPNWSGVVPFVEGGFGGGVRLGVGFRATRRAGR